MQDPEHGGIKLLFTQNKKVKKMLRKISVCLLIGLFCGVFDARAEEFEEVVEIDQVGADEMSANALEDYEVEGTLFEKITTLEQDKVVMQLEKDRIELDLALDRLSKEKIKIQQELEAMSGRAERQQQELEDAKAELEKQAEQLRKQMEALNEKKEEVQQQPEPVKQEVAVEEPQVKFAGKYKLINVIGVGNQLHATIQEISTGQNKRIAVGKQLDGYTIKSISLNDGIVFEKDGVSENLNVGR